MSTRADKALKAQKEKHHAILRELVQEPGNKTCAECLSKGPRWASWSLGVFMCIRCAGIHRNLGVHISKVKSVDLDSWSTEQIENILKWGNKRASEYYECYLPKDFTRPQGNHAVEAFIRSKYEKKLYVKKDGEPEPNDSAKLNKLKESSVPASKENKPQSNRRRERPEKKSNDKSGTILTMAAENTPKDKPASAARLAAGSHHVKSSSMNDLLSLDHPGPTTPDIKPSASSNDLLSFGLFSEPVPTQTPDLFETGDSTTSVSADPFQTSNATEMPKSEPPKSAKDSIMSLYSSGNTQQKMYGVPGGVYMSQQQQQTPTQQPNMMYGGYTQRPMVNQMGQMNSQMQQMNLNVHLQQQQQQQQQQHQQQQQRPMGFNQQQSSSNQQPSRFSQQPPSFSQQPQSFSQQPTSFNQQPPSFNQQYQAYNQQQMGYNQQISMNQTPGFTSNTYSSNSMMGNQINNFSQPQKYPQQNNFGNLMGQNAMTNTMSTNPNVMGGMQQPILSTGTAAGTMNFNAAMGNTNTGNTMSNQLWN